MLRNDPNLGSGNRIRLVGIEMGIRKKNKLGWDQNGIWWEQNSKDRSEQGLSPMPSIWNEILLIPAPWNNVVKTENLYNLRRRQPARTSSCLLSPVSSCWTPPPVSSLTYGMKTHKKEECISIFTHTVRILTPISTKLAQAARTNNKYYLPETRK